MNHNMSPSANHSHHCSHNQPPILYASELAAQALRLAPEGQTYTGEPTVCAMCSRPINKGDLAQVLKPSKSFTDWLSLTPSRHQCGWCAVTTQQANMRPLQRAIITREGVYPVGKDDNRAWFLLTPPEPPYAVVISTGAATSAFHLHWRTPVTLSNDCVVVRLHDVISTIRRPVLMAALKQCEELAAIELAAAPPKRHIKAASVQRRHAFVALDRNLDAPNHGRIRDSAITAARAAGRDDLISAMANLTPAELWALATLAKGNPATPTQPDLITSPAVREADEQA